MRKVAFLTFMIAFSSLSLAQQTITGEIEVDGIMRDYRLFIPSDVIDTEPIPLVFNLHGFTSSAQSQEANSAMNVVAEQEKFLVCYPNGVGAAWNVDWEFGSTADDVFFLKELKTRLTELYNADPNRTYSCGMSNGGFMSYRLACELSDEIAAIASVTGSMSPNNFNSCSPSALVPILQIHGTADPIVPYGGAFGISVSIDDVINFWMDNNSCSSSADTTFYEDIDMTDSSTASRIDYKECNEDKQVSLIIVEGGGHTWPGSQGGFGVTNQDIIASQVIWEFFQNFSLEGTSNVADLESEKTIIYPNPTSDYINISDAYGTFELISYDGRSILNGRIAENERINVSDLRPGAYFLKISSSKGSQMEKFIKL